MKNFKIINLFIFLFVINLSITFLYKNNLFATFINGVLQTNDKNFLQRKQRSLAEAGSHFGSFLRHEDSVSCFINKMHRIEVQTSEQMVNLMLEGCVDNRLSVAADLSIYSTFFNRFCRREGVEISHDIMAHYHNYFYEAVYRFNIVGFLKNDFIQFQKAAKLDYEMVKNIVHKYIQEPDQGRKDNLVSINFVKTFLEDQVYDPEDLSVKFHKFPETFFMLLKDIIALLNEKKLL